MVAGFLWQVAGVCRPPGPDGEKRMSGIVRHGSTPGDEALNITCLAWLGLQVMLGQFGKRLENGSFQ